MKKIILIASVALAVMLNGVFFARQLLNREEVRTGSGIIVMNGSGGSSLEALVMPDDNTEYQSLLWHYKQDGVNFKIEAYKTNGLYIDLYNECSEYVQEKSKPAFNTWTFLSDAIKKKEKGRSDIDIDIDFSKKPRCESGSPEPYCVFLVKYPPSGEITLKEASFGLWALNSGDISYDRFREMFRDPTRIRFPEVSSDIKYAEYYSSLVSGKIHSSEDCIRFISKKQNDLLR